MDEKEILKEERVPFKILHEDFHVFETSDGSTISAKFVMINIVKTYGDELDPSKLLFNAHNVIGVFSPIEIRGEKDRNYTVEELNDHITEENIMFRIIQDGGKNTYETEDFDLMINYRVTRIDKTSKFDKLGQPSYIIRSENELVVSEKEDQKKPEEGSDIPEK